MIDECRQSCLSKMAFWPRPPIVAYVEHHVEHSARPPRCLFGVKMNPKEREARGCSADSSA